MPSLLEHRGLTHSVVFFFAVAFPSVLVWKKQVVPYLAAFASHPFLGDYLTASGATGGLQLFFPLSPSRFSGGSEVPFFTYAYLELALFIAFLTLILTTRDIMTLIKKNSSNLLLVIPISTALLPVFLQFPLSVPPILIIPHLILIILLALPVFIDLKHLICRQHRF
jgi:membrane-bound metal-dependent hydrolase YbcI (DUF457 family)